MNNNSNINSGCMRFSKNGITAYNADCFNIFPEIEDKSVDLIFCDLPYGTTKCKWDIIIPMEDTIEIVNNKGRNKGKSIRLNENQFLLKCYAEGLPYEHAKQMFDESHTKGLWWHYNRIVKDNGAIVLFGSQPFSSTLIETNKDMFKYSLVWYKTSPTNYLNAKKQPMRIHEDLMVFYKKQPTYNPQKTTGHVRKVSKIEHRKNCIQTEVYNNHGSIAYDSTERYPTSVKKFKSDTQKLALHSTQKPVKLCEDIILTYTNENDMVLDNCAGSMSAGVACQNLNRKAILMEINEKYFNDGIKRL